MQDYERAAIDFAVKLAALAITVKCEFVPQSLSRNAGEKALSLNWRVAVLKDGRPIRGIENVDYMQGIGHAPSHNSPPKFTDGRPDKWRQGEYAKIEAEQGKRAAISTLTGNGYAIASQPLPPPSASDVLFSLCLDASALDYAAFEDWAIDYGYDADSRKADGIYKQCLAYGLALRAAIGDADLSALRDLANEM